MSAAEPFSPAWQSEASELTLRAQTEMEVSGMAIALVLLPALVLPFFRKHAGFTVSTCSQMHWIQIDFQAYDFKVMFDSIPTNPRLFIKF